MAFAQVEAKPQAIEWIFHQACGHGFVVSLDNIALEDCDMTAFKSAIIHEARRYQSSGLPERAEAYRDALAEFYGTQELLIDYCFDLKEV